MIFITGDIHGDKNRFKQVRKAGIKKNDTLLVTGDFGFIWDGSRAEKKLLSRIGKLKYNVLFVDGYNDNTELLLTYPEQYYMGGKTKVISGNLRMLMRGEIFNIDGKKIFAFGGGDSQEPEHTNSHDALKLPTTEEMDNGIANLAKVDNTVDIVLTHDAPAKLKLFINMENNELSHLHQYLENIKNNITFTQWYFGKFHMNKVIPPFYTSLFTNVIKINF